MRPQNPRLVPEDFSGIVHALRKRTPEEFVLLDDLRVSWVLNTFYWSTIEPRQDEWNFSEYDAFVNAALARGKKVCAVLAYEASWLDKGRKRYISPENLSLFLRFVEKTVDRYKDHVDAWEIWNEPNGIFWKGTKQEFFELTKATAQKIREVDPDAVILGGAFMWAPRGYIQGMFDSGAMDELSAIAFHPYGINPRYSAKLFDKIERILSRNNYNGEIWITEVGFPTEGWYPSKVRERDLPSYVVKTYAYLAARGSRTMFWYQMYDDYNPGEEPSRGNSEDFFGLVYPNYTLKPGAASYALCARFLPGAEYRPEFPQRTGIPNKVASYYFRGKNGDNILILWNEASRPLSLSIELSGAPTFYDIVSGRTSDGKAVLAVGSGEGREQSRSSVLELGKTPVIVVWEGENENTPPRILKHIQN
jgi:hypothetical protein